MAPPQFLSVFVLCNIRCLDLSLCTHREVRCPCGAQLARYMSDVQYLSFHLPLRTNAAYFQLPLANPCTVSSFSDLQRRACGARERRKGRRAYYFVGFFSSSFFAGGNIVLLKPTKNYNQRRLAQAHTRVQSQSKSWFFPRYEQSLLGYR